MSGRDVTMTEPANTLTDRRDETPAWALLAVGLAGVVGLTLLVDSLGKSSATYDEVAYLRIAATWWRTGDQSEITWMGSPLTFWKLQQVPVLWALDRAGFRWMVDDPLAHQAILLPMVRLGSLWIWMAALALTAAWSRRLYGARAMVLSAWLFALSPNLLAHGALATMELPLVACTTAMFFSFWEFLRSGRLRWFAVSAAVGGLAFSCKFTTVLVPPLLALVWLVDRWRNGAGHSRPSLADGAPPSSATGRSHPWPWRTANLFLVIASGMIAYLALLLVANFLVTSFAVSTMAHGTGPHPSIAGRFAPSIERWLSRAIETPIPQDWVGLTMQLLQQRKGGASYLLGARRLTGWWYYYFVALAVKVPLSFAALFAARSLTVGRTSAGDRGWMLPLVIVVFLGVVAAFSGRNYGVRYLLPLAPLALVWVSALAERGARWCAFAWLGVLGQALAVGSVHPHELTYFNAIAGGPKGGRFILADSNLDWGQGLKSLARLQREDPRFRDLTLYYFGDTDPHLYGVTGQCYTIDAGSAHPSLPRTLTVRTRYVGVSASLQFGPWGPPGYFQALDDRTPVATTDDTTIAIYEWAQ
jgi:hypothetical protein